MQITSRPSPGFGQISQSLSFDEGGIAPFGVVVTLKCGVWESGRFPLGEELGEMNPNMAGFNPFNDSQSPCSHLVPPNNDMTHLFLTENSFGAD